MQAGEISDLVRFYLKIQRTQWEGLRFGPRYWEGEKKKHRVPGQRFHVRHVTVQVLLCLIVPGSKHGLECGCPSLVGRHILDSGGSLWSLLFWGGQVCHHHTIPSQSSAPGVCSLPHVPCPLWASLAARFLGLHMAGQPGWTQDRSRALNASAPQEVPAPSPTPASRLPICAKEPRCQVMRIGEGSLKIPAVLGLDGVTSLSRLRL